MREREYRFRFNELRYAEVYTFFFLSAIPEERCPSVLPPNEGAESYYSLDLFMYAAGPFIVTRPFVASFPFALVYLIIYDLILFTNASINIQSNTYMCISSIVITSFGQANSARVTYHSHTFFSFLPLIITEK